MRRNPSTKTLLARIVKAKEIALIVHNFNRFDDIDVIVKTMDVPVTLAQVCKHLGVDPVALSRIFPLTRERKLPAEKRSTVRTIEALTKHHRLLTIGDVRGWAMLTEMLGKHLRVAHQHTDQLLATIRYRITPDGQVWERVFDLHPGPPVPSTWDE